MNDQISNADNSNRLEALEQARETLHKELQTKDRSRIQAAYQNMKTIFFGNDALWANEVQANWMTALTQAVVIVVLLLTLVLTELSVFHFNLNKLSGYLAVCILQMALSIVLCFVFKGERSWLKYVEIGVTCLTMACIYAILGSRVSLIMSIPVILSIRYLSDRFTAIIAVLTAFLFLISTILYAFFGVAPDLNCIPYANDSTLTIVKGIEEAVAAQGYSLKDYLLNLLKWTYLSNLLQYVIISLISFFVARYCHQTVLQEAKITEKNARIDTELELARSIQVHSLPNTFPAFPGRIDFDLYASMTPAKEIGGDFDDFFLLDDHTLGMVVADVSGKGIPAALFMMRAKTMIKNIANSGIGPAAVFTKANHLLCDNNPEGLFVTAWFGKLDTRTGVITAANAGHEYPAIMHAGGAYELFKDKHGFVLGGMDGVKYREYELKLDPGDRLFLYTDGVTEATNSKDELFGTDRMLKLLNQYRSLDQKGLLEGVRNGLTAYAAGVPQFDDITMLGLEFFGEQKNHESTPA